MNPFSPPAAARSSPPKTGPAGEDEVQPKPSALERAKGLRNRAKKTTKRILLRRGESQYDADTDDGDDDDDDDDDASSGSASDDLFSDVAFNPAKVLDDDATIPKSSGEVMSSVKQNLKSIPSMIAHPRHAMRNKATKTAAGKIGSGRRPVTSVARDREFLDAHDALAKAKSNSKPSSMHGFESNENDSDVGDAKVRVKALEQQRESLQMAWVLARHVTRVKAVEFPAKPRWQDFENRPGRFEWEKYLGKMALYQTRGFTAHYVDDFERQPFDLRDLARTMERLAITSAPWQAFLLDVRRVYRWDDPWRTARWAALYWMLWYTQYIGSYLFAWVIWSTLRNRFRATSVEEVRESARRGLDREAKVRAWGELIQRHGKHDWIEPLLEDLGPLIQMQLGDLANFLEVLLNFHRHERPAKTAGTLFYFSICLLVTLTTDMAFCIKVFWFVAGCWFFFEFPISTRYPKYRLVCSWLRWIFWDIPTHAELAILRLQEKAAVKDARQIESEVSSSPAEAESDEGSDYFSCSSSVSAHSNRRPLYRYSFKVHHRKHLRGRLVVSRYGLEYHSGKAKHLYRHVNLMEMRKTDINSKMDKAKSLQSDPGGIHFIWCTESRMQDLELIVQRADQDKIFNLVIAWSDLKWQALQMERHSDIADERSRLEKTLKRAIG